MVAVPPWFSFTVAETPVCCCCMLLLNPCMLLLKIYVRMRGVEPPRPKALPPEDSVSTNFTTCAWSFAR